jgi:hypothetical protein
VDFELSGVTQDGPIELVASLRDEKGKEEKRFTQTVNVKAAATQRVQVHGRGTTRVCGMLTSPICIICTSAPKAQASMTSRSPNLASAKCGCRGARCFSMARHSASVPL